MKDVRKWEKNNMTNYVEVIVIIIFLLICSYYDIRESVIYTNVCTVFALFAILFELVVVNEEMIVLFCGIMPSVFIFIISIISNESIGKGDALIFFVIGIMFGIVKSMLIFLIALVITVFYSMPLILFKQKKLKSSIPFSPFILTSFIVFCLF